MALRSVTRFAVAFQARTPLVIGCRTIISKARRGDYERPKPFPQDEKDYKLRHELTDRTTVRWEENTKVIVVDGAHAVGKTQFAQELADEFDMKLFNTKVSDRYINYYGHDLNDYAVYLDPIMRPYDERDFSRNPTGPVEGAGDRFHLIAWQEKFRNYLYALKHLYNTGQGVVVEGDPWSDYAHLEAAYNQGWVDRTTRNAIKLSQKWGLINLLRPHLLVYLDAPTEVVMRNIKARGNPWDKDSPVWTNKRYLNDIYNEKKRRYLMKQQKHSHVLVYDWSTPGETDIVVDDIEKIELDFTDEYDDLLRDWTINRTEQKHTILRYRYCNMAQRTRLMADLNSNEEFLEADLLYMDPDNNAQMQAVLEHTPGDRWAPGVNSAMGDKNIWATWDIFKSVENLPRYCEKPLYPWVRKWQRFGHDQDQYLEPVKCEK